MKATAKQIQLIKKGGKYGDGFKEGGKTMKCKKCREEIAVGTMRIRKSETNDKLDVQAWCPYCQRTWFAFLEPSDFVEEE